MLIEIMLGCVTMLKTGGSFPRSSSDCESSMIHMKCDEEEEGKLFLRQLVNLSHGKNKKLLHFH